MAERRKKVSPPTPAKRLLSYFLRGLVLTTPAVVTAGVCWIVFTRIDGWLGLPIPGAGFVVTIAAITLVGFLGSTFLWGQFMEMVEQLLDRLPFVRLLYSSTKDLLNAFVGEKRRFDAPVLVAMTADGSVRAFGFITQPSLKDLGLADDVAVYFPQSYNFAGNIIVVAHKCIQPLAIDSARAMAFVVSGGVSGTEGAEG
jgi:uncharacterized membrane protein